MHWLGRRIPTGLTLILLAGLEACSSVMDPVPSPLYDGSYAGRRWSDKTVECGITEPRGTTTARISNGRLNLPLFGSRTRLEGTVGADGTLRASGLWPNPHGGFPGMTVLTGKIQDGVLQGVATDHRCTTELELHRTGGPSRGRAPGPRAGSRPGS
jgi:hypothetical protein